MNVHVSAAAKIFDLTQQAAGVSRVRRVRVCVRASTRKHTHTYRGEKERARTLQMRGDITLERKNVY